MAVICAECGQENPDGFRFCGRCGASLAEPQPAREVRKTVTVLFADVTGSTALGESRDPEAVRAQMARWFEDARTILTRHGGTVEKFIGDAVMAVFGIPRAHEDDALRAVRAAAELQRPELRIGVNTGEVVAGEAETLVTGDAVNVAARLEQAAAPGEVLIGVETHRLVRDAVEARPVEPLELKGKAAPVEAYRLVRVDPAAEGVARRFDSPLVGRTRELERLRRDFEHAAAEGAPHLFTLLGTAGVGKSRLAAEFLAGVDATMVRGRCLQYGEGITYFPLVEVMLQLGADPTSVIGLPTPTDIALATRRLVEREAADRPLIVVFDDIQWAEPTFLDLVEHIADLARAVPLFLLCIARPELLEVRPTWAGGKLNATTVLLEPLGRDETAELVATLGSEGVGEALVSRIVESSGGNPLFVEEMVAMVGEDGGEVIVPPTIHALLQARLDTLAMDERAVIERGAVEGEVFHRAPVAELAPDDVRATVDTQLAGLVRKELIRPHKSVFLGDDAYRFRHLLIRDAAYESLPKETRADLHERFALWLDEHVALVEQDEIVGYHLEQAVLYRRELGRDDAGLAERASRRLGRAGQAALGRADYHASTNLLERAADLLPSGDELRAALLVDLSRSAYETGRVDEARTWLDEASEAADERTRSLARIEQTWVALGSGVESFDAIGPLIEELIPVFERLQDDLGLARVYWSAAGLEWAACRARETGVLARRALHHAERAGARDLLQEILGMLATLHMHGPTPVAEAHAEIESQLTASSGLLIAETAQLRALGRLAAMRGEFAEARELMRRGREPLAEAGASVTYWSTAQGLAFIEEACDDLDAEERVLREGVAHLQELGEHGFLSTNMMALAACLERQGRDDEALEWISATRDESPPGDLVNFICTDATEAVILARRGKDEDALALARSSVADAEETDFWRVRTMALEALGAALASSGDSDGARSAYDRALHEYERKGAVPYAERTRALLAEF